MNFLLEEQQRLKLEQQKVALLPAWFIERMMSDNWCFGLLLTTGHILCIQSIDDIVRAADGSVWIDVDMHDSYTQVSGQPKLPILISPTTRTKASVNVANIVAAFELADT